MNDKAPSVPRKARGVVLLGYFVIILAFGGLGTWAAVAKIDSAIFGTGAVQVKTKNKTVQHYEGGIVRTLHVQDDMKVKKGQLLVDLDTTSSKANLDVLHNQLHSEIAVIARLEAEQRGSKAIEFPKEILALKDNTVVEDAKTDQTALFEKRRSYQEAQIEILDARIGQIKEQNAGLEIQKEAIVEQLKLYDEELNSLKQGEKKGVIPRNQLLQKKRSYAALKGEKGEFISDIATNEGRILELEEQKKQVSYSFLQEVGDALARAKLNRDKLREQVVVAEDVFKRNRIFAPYDGVVQNVRFHTVGGVIQQGEPIMDLIPVNDDLVVSVRVQPIDIDKIKQGLSAEVRFPSFASRRLPIILGEVMSMSADTLMDKATNTPYFSVQVTVAEEDIPDEIASLITPGLPADVVIATGERTVLNYLVAPLENSIRQAMREK